MDILGSVKQERFNSFPGTSQEQTLPPLSYVLWKWILLLTG